MTLFLLAVLFFGPIDDQPLPKCEPDETLIIDGAKPHCEIDAPINDNRPVVWEI